MLCKNISRLRKSRGLTQVEFAKRLNVTQGAVSQWENGRTMPDTYQLLRIAKAFDITVDELTDGEDVFPADMSEPKVFIAPSTKGSHSSQEVTVTATGPDGVTQQLMQEAVHYVGSKPDSAQWKQSVIQEKNIYGTLDQQRAARITEAAEILQSMTDEEYAMALDVLRAMARRK